jgi:hypothetical protein
VRSAFTFVIGRGSNPGDRSLSNGKTSMPMCTLSIRTLLPYVLSIMLPSMVIAQGNERTPHAGRHAHDGSRMEKLADQLQLTPDQVRQMELLRARHVGKMRALRGMPDGPERQEAMRRAKEEERSTLSGILNDEQLASYRALQEARSGGHGHGGAHDILSERMRHALELSDEQVAALRALRSERIERTNAIKAMPEGHERTKAWAGSRAERREAIASVLTPEQLSRWEAMKMERTHPQGPCRTGR